MHSHDYEQPKGRVRFGGPENNVESKRREKPSVRIIDSRNPEMSEFTERMRKLSLACHSRSILMSLIYVVVLTDVVSSFDFPPTTSSLSSSARSLVRNSFPCEQPNLRLPQFADAYQVLAPDS